MLPLIRYMFVTIIFLIIYITIVAPPLANLTDAISTANEGNTVGIGAFVGDDTISITSGTVTAGATGQLEIDGSDLTGDTVLTNIDVSGTTAEIDPSDKDQFDLTGGVTAFTFKSGFAEDDGTADISYTSTSSFDLTVRGLSANTDYIFETAGGTVLGVGATDGSGTMTIIWSTSPRRMAP